MNIKAIILAGLIPLIKAFNSEAGQLVDDLNTSLEDGKLTRDEIDTLVKSALATARSLWPAGEELLNNLEVNLTVDIPNIEKTIKSFQDLQQ